MSTQRLNFTLPDDVVKILNKKAKDGEKSAFVAEAIRQHSKPKMTKKFIEDFVSEQDRLEFEYSNQMVRRRKSFHNFD